MEFADLKAQYAALKESIDARMRRVLEHGQYILGPEVRELEERLAAYTGAKHCITCASGTEALLIGLMAAGIGPGDEVITTPFTFVATAEMIVLLGGKPVFVDIEPDTYNIDTDQVGAAVTSRTRAILPVSLYGQTADMNELNAIGARHGLPVIEDAAQSFGALYKGRRSCNLSTMGCTSFFPSKPLGCYGDGGAVFTSDDGLAEAVRHIRVHGQDRRYHHIRIGVGGRMDTLQCAVVLAKLERFDWELIERDRLAQRYRERLEPLGLPLPAVRADRTCVYAQFTVRVQDRDRVQQALKERGIPTAVHYPMPLHLQPAYRDFKPASPLPHCERAAEEVLCLPFSADLGDDNLSRTVAALGECLQRNPARF
jgi:UDP-2-acetamido-2-deoxy-ribo-hexuluronate aminotransferase